MKIYKIIIKRDGHIIYITNPIFGKDAANFQIKIYKYIYKEDKNTSFKIKKC